MLLLCAQAGGYSVLRAMPLPADPAGMGATVASETQEALTGNLKGTPLLTSHCL